MMPTLRNPFDHIIVTKIFGSPRFSLFPRRNLLERCFYIFLGALSLCRFVVRGHCGSGGKMKKKKSVGAKSGLKMGWFESGGIVGLGSGGYGEGG